MAYDDDYFQLSEDAAAEPLDVTPVSQPSATPKQDKSKWIKLALIAPLLAKGGPGALQGFLSGLNSATERKRVMDHREMMDRDMMAQRQSQAQSLEQYRQAQIANQQEQIRQKQYSDFVTQVRAAETPDELQAIGTLYKQRGLKPGVVDSVVLSQTPAMLQSKKLKKVWDGYSAALKEEAIRTKATINVDGVPITFDQWSGMVGAPELQAAPTTAKADVPNTPEERMYAALKSGNTAEAQLLEESAKRISGARRQEQDPALANINRQLAEARLANLAAAKNTSGLPPRAQRQVDTYAKGFDTQPITRRTQVMGEAVSFVNGLDENTKNPADDQALIYAFAKAMDPESVVREGEYSTVQKYAQTWAQNFGFNAQRIFSNVAFLTPEARKNMKATIQSRYAAARAQYDNVRRSYADRINKATGGTDGESYLIDYGGGLPGIGEQPQPNRAVPKGKPIDLGGGITVRAK